VWLDSSVILCLPSSTGVSIKLPALTHRRLLLLENVWSGSGSVLVGEREAELHTPFSSTVLGVLNNSDGFDHGFCMSLNIMLISGTNSFLLTQLLI